MKLEQAGLISCAGSRPSLAHRCALRYSKSQLLHLHTEGTHSQCQCLLWWCSEHYEEAKAGVAWSLSPTGPFHYVGSARPHDEMSRDMTLFKVGGRVGGG